MADIPLTVWPDEFAYVQQDLTRLYEHHPRYESSWFGSLVSTFAIVCPPSSPRRYSIRPQFILRQPVGGVLANEHTPGPDLADPDPDDDSDSDDGLAEVSFVSHDFQVQGRGQGREHAIRIPDFVIDHVQNGRRNFMLLVEVKASTNVGSKDFMRFTRYLRRLEEIGAAGGAVHDVEVMLIAGGRAYNWSFGNLPLTLTMDDLSDMDFLPINDVAFLNRLIEIRNATA